MYVSDSGVSCEDPPLAPSSHLVEMLRVFFTWKYLNCVPAVLQMFGFGVFFTRSWVFLLLCCSWCSAGMGRGKTCGGKIRLWFRSRNQIRSLRLI